MTRGRILGVLFTGVLLGALDIAIVGPALPAIQKSFGVDSRAIAWVFSIYILFYILGAPLMAKWSDRQGRRRVFVGCVGLFGAGSVLVAAAPAFGIVLLGRAVQAFGAGGIFPVATAVVAETFPEERRGRALGLLGAVFGIAFIIGPILGGVLLRYSWHWLFLINVPLALAVMWGALRALPTTGESEAGPIDRQGALVLSVFLVVLAVGISSLDTTSWVASLASLRVWPFLLAAIVAAPIFWLVEHRAADPILHPALFRSGQLRIVGVIGVAAGLVEAGMVFLPELSVQAFGVSPSTASFMLLPLVVTLLFGAPAAGRALDRIGAKPVIQAGLLLTIAGLAGFGLLPTSRIDFYASGIAVGLGLSALLGAPLRYVVLQEAGERRRGAGQGLLTLFLSLGQLFGSTLVGAVVASGGTRVAGYRDALLTLGVICAVAALTSVGLSRRRAPVPQTAE
jgi:MFS family permease